jgi:cytochrome c-type biogenesis protein CcmE
MTPRQKRMVGVAGIVAGVSLAAWLAAQAFQRNVNLFLQPKEVAAGKAHEGQQIRLGGMVEKGSVKRTEGTLDIRFVVTDFEHSVPVTYSGVLPTLFREGQGVVARGHMQGGTFVANEILAKHDEKYMPPKIEKALEGKQPPATGATGT